MTWLNWRGEAAKQMADAIARETLLEVGEEIIDEAKLEVPYRDRNLQRSGKARRSRSRVPSVLLSFGGKGVPYAVRWHNRPARFRHGRKRRYLADPYNRLAWPRTRAVYRRKFRQRLQGA